MKHNTVVWLVVAFIVLGSATLLSALLPLPYVIIASAVVGAILGWNVPNFLE